MYVPENNPECQTVLQNTRQEFTPDIYPDKDTHSDRERRIHTYTVIRKSGHLRSKHWLTWDAAAVAAAAAAKTTNFLDRTAEEEVIIQEKPVVPGWFSAADAGQ